MKKFLLTCSLLLAACAAWGRTDVQALAPGLNILVGGPGAVSQIEAVASSASGTITIKRVIDRASYSTATATVTNSWTNSVAWTYQTITNKVVSLQDVYLTVTNAVYTNVVLGATNVIRDIVRRQNGTRPVTNDIVVVKPVWTNTPLAFVTSTVTNDVVSHALYTNTVGTITLSNHVGTLVPTNLNFVAGDRILVEPGSVTGATLRLYSKED